MHAVLPLKIYTACYRPAADAASSSAPGIASETIPEDEAEDDVAPTPEQLEVKLHSICSVQMALHT